LFPIADGGFIGRRHPMENPYMSESDTIQKMAFSVDEAAMRAGLGRDVIYQALRDKRLGGKKAGRRTLVTAEALKQFIDDLPPYSTAR
jgi:excisionase family DNA binding protein